MKASFSLITTAPLLVALLSPGAQAQTQPRSAHIYRCGPEGKDLRDSPCPGGSAASSTHVYDQPSAADTQAARQRHQAEAQRAAEAQKAHQEAEAQARRTHAGAVALKTAPPPLTAASASATHKPHSPKPPKAPKAAKGPKAPALGASQAGR